MSQDVPRPESNPEESAEELYEMAPCGYLTTTGEGRIIKVNKTLTDWLGYQNGELTGGKKFIDLLTVGGRVFYETHLSLLLRIKPTVDEIALDILRKDGSALPVLINARQKRNSAGEPIVNRFTIFNATERRIYERELLATRDLLRTTLSSIGDGVIATDAEGRITFMNPVAEVLCGWSSDAAQGKPVGEVLRMIHEDHSVPVENPIMHALRAGEIVGLADDTMLVSKDGRHIPIDDSASPITDAAGNVVGAILVFRDISQRRKNEELERARQDQQREAARLASLGLMAGGIAHDYNNLLTVILGNASLLAESVSARDASLVDEIVHASERAARLTRQILSYSGQNWLEIALLDLNAHIRENLTLLRASLPAGIHIELELGGPAGFAAEADAAQIQQVIMDLVINASEAIQGDSGTIAIRTDVVEQRPARFSGFMQSMIPSGTYAMLEIRDNGAGMSEDTLKNIFDPFFTTKFMGRGLGLSAVLGIVKAHRGDIEVVSGPGVGSTFRVFLPAAQCLPQPPLAPGAVPSVTGDEIILVVDDEEIIRRLAVNALKSRGMRVLAARNGREALEVLGAEPGVSIVILDLTMPVMNGEEALPLIKAIRPDLPVIISSGFSEAEVLRRLQSSGIAGVLSKPYTVDAMVSKVVAALRGANSANYDRTRD